MPDDTDDISTPVFTAGLLLALGPPSALLAWWLLQPPAPERPDPDSFVTVSERPQPSSASPDIGITPSDTSAPDDAPLTARQKLDRPAPNVPADAFAPASEAHKHYMKASKLWLLGQNRRAAEICETDPGPAYPPCLKIAALARRRLGDTEAACRHLRAYLAGDPDDTKRFRGLLQKMECD